MPQTPRRTRRCRKRMGRLHLSLEPLEFLAQPAGSLRLLYQVLGQHILLAEMAVAQLERFPVEH